MKRITLCLALLMALAPINLLAQDAVTISIDGNAKIGPYKPIFSYFGYDEPNYTYMKDGRKLVGELARLSHTPVFIRAH
ncbi:MAG TPA: beta-xylosidase, partial [Blastocatellia bacterium]|nr:beta-xylosidase [Blastocatellia bacterium]